MNAHVCPCINIVKGCVTYVYTSKTHVSYIYTYIKRYTYMHTYITVVFYVYIHMCILELSYTHRHTHAHTRTTEVNHKVLNRSCHAPQTGLLQLSWVYPTLSLKWNTALCLQGDRHRVTALRPCGWDTYVLSRLLISKPAVFIVLTFYSILRNNEPHPCTGLTWRPSKAR